MRIDLEARLTLGFIFGLTCLSIELVAGLFGAPVNDALTATFGTIVVGTFTAGMFVGSRKNGDDNGR